MQAYIIENARLVLPGKVTQAGWLRVENGMIHSFGEGVMPPQFGESGERVDAQGAYLSPGFVDLHVHGGGGADFRDADAQAYRTVLRTHLQGGTTAMMPTLSASTHETTLACLRVYNALKGDACENNACRAPRAEQQSGEENEQREPPLPRMLGVHLEGPYFSQKERGAQDESILRLPDCDEAQRFLAACSDIRRWSVAPELPGAAQLGALLAARGVTVCVGHSDATTAQVEAAFASGYSCVTHLYSGCSHVHRNGPFREGGVVEAAFLLRDMDVEVIADGCHLPRELLQLIYAIKGTGRIALITDSTRGGGQEYPNGTVLYDDKEKRRSFVVESGVAMMPDKKNFAGSIATTARLVRTMVHTAGVPLWEAVAMATLTPARMAGAQRHIGSIAVGKRADLLLFDDAIQIKTVWAGGVCAYRP